MDTLIGVQCTIENLDEAPVGTIVSSALAYVLKEDEYCDAYVKTNNAWYTTGMREPLTSEDVLRMSSFARFLYVPMRPQ